MEDNPARQELLARTAGNWSVFTRLLDLSRNGGDSLPRILRAHLESETQTEPEAADAALRAELDDALDCLLLLELGCETGCLGAEDVALPTDLTSLFQLDSFLRYLDSYLYFGVRLLAGRSCDWTSPPPGAVNAKCNRVPLPLRPPAPPHNLSAESRQKAVLDFLALPVTSTISEALAFLEDFSCPPTHRADREIHDPTTPHQRIKYELWMRGLWHDPEINFYTETRFLSVTTGLTEWALNRVKFYKDLEDETLVLDPAWIARNPLSARFAVADVYWLAGLLGADISSAGHVVYAHKSWIDQIAARAEYIGDSSVASDLREAAIVLRGVFDFACDLLQNSIEITEECLRRNLEPDSCPVLPPPAANWRDTFDEELNEIDRQQFLRTFEGEETGFSPESPSGEERGWSRRIRTGEYPRREVTGLAISGGGIRSATFALGVLQGLQELDLLKSVDYISTVSGGGYIGSWLVGNVQRTAHFLGRHTNWEESISHLRRYSKYLSPHTGILSADSWTMWGIWVRNAFLIQIMAVAWLLCILSACLLGKPLFDGLSKHPTLFGIQGAWIARILVWLSIAWIGVAVRANLMPDRRSLLRGKSLTEWQVQWQLVIPAWISAFLTSGLLWAQATGNSTASYHFTATAYASIFRNAYTPWLEFLAAVAAGFILLGFATLNRVRAAALLFGPMVTAVLYAELCAIMWVFRAWDATSESHGWYAFIFGPSFVLIAAALSVVLFIGLCGRSSDDQTREWWTRMGSWLGIYGTGYLILACAAVLGPLWMLSLFRLNWGLELSAVAGFVGTILGGVNAGKSSKTNGTANNRMEYIARLGAFLFIAGGLFGVATILHFFLLNVFTLSAPSTGPDYWYAMSDLIEGHPMATVVTCLATLSIGLLLSWRIELNVFGLNYFYRNRLVRCYLGATRWRPGMRSPNKFTGFDEEDDIPLDSLRHDGDHPCQRPFRGPFPVINCTLNLGGSADLSVQTRKSAPFVMTPLRCGSTRANVGFAPTAGFSGGIKLGQAVSVSGAAASPNMGYNTSTLVSFLLTMFNVRLGWWFPNPSGKCSEQKGLPAHGFFYLVRELFGYANEKSAFLNVSDGGHFENLGIYELIRRRTKVIIVSDGECDQGLQFGSLGNLVRICETDLGARIDIDVSSIHKQENGLSQAHCAVGRITYSNGSEGWLIYLKASILGDEGVGIAQYRAVHPDFPHQSTADQFFTEDQFDAYRKLGRHVVQHSFRGINPGAQLTAIAQRMFDTWTPARFPPASFLAHTKTLDALWERFRQSPVLHKLLEELTALKAPLPDRDPPTAEELCACLELLQLMENVFVDLKLGDYWAHPDNRGWAMLFSSWARSARFRAAWVQMRRTFGIRFEYFCEERLGLEKERPVTRV